MSALTSSDCINQWGDKLRAAAACYPVESYNGKQALPAWLLATARDQAERVFLVLDGTPVEQRDMAEGERLVETSGRAVLTAWADMMEAFGSGGESWAMDAMKAAAQSYADRLDELASRLHAGGRA